MSNTMDASGQPALVPGAFRLLSSPREAVEVYCTSRHFRRFEFHYPVDSAPDFGVGSEVDVAWCVPVSGEVRQERALVTERATLRRRQAYRLKLTVNGPDWFDFRESNSLEVERQFYRLLVTRSDVPWCAVVPVIAGKRGPSVEATLIDLSEEGCSVDLPRDFDVGRAMARTLELRLLLARRREPLELVGRILHRSLRKSAVRYGLAFAFERNPLDVRRQADLRTFIVDMQRLRLSKE